VRVTGYLIKNHRSIDHHLTSYNQRGDEYLTKSANTNSDWVKVIHMAPKTNSITNKGPLLALAVNTDITNEGIAQTGLVAVEEPEGDVTGDVITWVALIVPYIYHNMERLVAYVLSKMTVSMSYAILLEES